MSYKDRLLHYSAVCYAAAWIIDRTTHMEFSFMCPAVGAAAERLYDQLPGTKPRDVRILILTAVSTHLGEDYGDWRMWDQPSTSLTHPQEDKVKAREERVELLELAGQFYAEEAARCSW